LFSKKLVLLVLLLRKRVQNAKKPEANHGNIRYWFHELAEPVKAWFHEQLAALPAEPGQEHNAKSQ
jgi:hypothetical protein